VNDSPQTAGPASGSEGLPERGEGLPQTALPPVAARVLAFLSVFIGAAAGGFIGYAFGELGGFGSVATGFLTLLVGLGFAGGVAVIAVLTLRALGEWQTIRRQGPEAVRAARAERSARRS